MRIEICEDNGLMFDDGRPTLVVLLITTDDGKTVRLPYQAERTIQQVYEDVRKIKNPVIGVGPTIPLSFGPLHPRPPVYREKDPIFELPGDDEDTMDDDENTKPLRVPIPGVIQPEDIIECTGVGIEVDSNPNGELKVGRHYRVVGINGTLRNVNFYEVVDDSADFKIRVNLPPNYCKLIKKFTPLPKTKVFKEMTIPCDSCNKMNLLRSETNVYKGRCRNCGEAIDTTSEKELAKMQAKEKKEAEDDAI